MSEKILSTDAIAVSILQSFKNKIDSINLMRPHSRFHHCVILLETDCETLHSIS